MVWDNVRPVYGLERALAGCYQRLFVTQLVSLDESSEARESDSPRVTGLPGSELAAGPGGAQDPEPLAFTPGPGA